MVFKHMRRVGDARRLRPLCRNGRCGPWGRRVMERWGNPVNSLWCLLWLHRTQVGAEVGALLVRVAWRLRRRCISPGRILGDVCGRAHRLWRRWRGENDCWLGRRRWYRLWGGRRERLRYWLRDRLWGGSRLWCGHDRRGTRGPAGAAPPGPSLGPPSTKTGRPG